MEKLHSPARFYQSLVVQSVLLNGRFPEFAILLDKQDPKGEVALA